MRPAVPGFGSLFCFALTRALAEPPPLNQAELLLPTLRASTPPAYCPCCTLPASSAERDASGDWTWNCAGGCNP